mgnify:CR=1 FL=1
MKRIAIVGLLVVILALGAIWVVTSRRSGSEPRVDQNTESGSRPSKASPAKAKPAKNAKSAKKSVAEKPKARYRRRHARGMSYADRTDLSAVEKRQLTALEEAVDADDFKKLMKVLPEAAASKNVEVRSEAVDALGWFGKDGMVEMLPFMADPDEDVATAARDAWTTSLSDIESEKVRGKYVASAMNILTDDDSLEAMVMALDDCDELVQVQALVDVIESGKNPKAVKVAKEHYEFVTDEPYTGLEAAEKWVAENSDAVREDLGESAVDEAVEDLVEQADAEEAAAAAAEGAATAPGVPQAVPAL